MDVFVLSQPKLNYVMRGPQPLTVWNPTKQGSIDDIN